VDARFVEIDCRVWAAGRCGRCRDRGLKVTPQTRRYTGAYRLRLQCRSCGFVE
jgi:hypothetical protein